MTPAGAERIKQPERSCNIRIPSRVTKALSEMASEMGGNPSMFMAAKLSTDRLLTEIEGCAESWPACKRQLMAWMHKLYFSGGLMNAMQGPARTFSPNRIRLPINQYM